MVAPNRNTTPVKLREQYGSSSTEKQRSVSNGSLDRLCLEKTMGSNKITTESKKQNQCIRAIINEAGCMTANDLQQIAMKLSNNTWTRYWLNYYGGNDGDPRIMAIQCIDVDGAPLKVYDLELYGFICGPQEIYFINRVL